MKEIEYLRNILGLDVREGGDLSEQRRGLPLYMKNFPDKELFINGQRVILEIMKDLQDSTPEQLQRQKSVLEKNYNTIVVFCFARLEAFERKRFIERKISFIVADKQAYLPELMMNLHEFRPAKIKERNVFTPATQFLLLYHLQMQDLDGVPLGTIPKYLKDYAAMSVSRAAKELTERGVCKVTGGRTKHLAFEYSKRETWEKAKPHLSSPIMQTVYMPDSPLAEELIRSGDSALAYYTRLSETGMVHLAISKRLYKAKDADIKFYPTPFGGSIRVDVWKYDPKLLSKHHFVDPLSLYLCYKDDTDERVQQALAELLRSVIW